MFETICDLIPRDNDYAPRTRTLGILRRVLDGTLYDVRIPMHPAHPYRSQAAHCSEVMAPTVPISSRPPF
jgi:hypothetical protein